ncbi:cation transporter [Desulforamulus ferrireducens]|uniref:Heavy metal transport/detoxification protein n=1 Tax=Desulforamulus ferrireducens TaxID=1833852 RepID=A0A1S6IWG4_9FIRM|nr:cation transporter [Desulforamulus ferrireducens]AQS59119.1 heavy metal transport/detoxification protein [Desulforamulus ferrireducens]
MAETITLKVEGMSCNHCKMAVEKAVQKLAGVQSVEATPSENLVKITTDGSSDLAAIKEAITEEGYTVVD